MEICEFKLTNLSLLNVETLITFLFQHCYNKIYVASQHILTASTCPVVFIFDSHFAVLLMT
jgi:hypothetical protein